MRKFSSILLVDDDYASNYLTEIVIQDLAISDSIHLATNGKEALQFVRTHCVEAPYPQCPQLIFLDINMPVMDGFEFMEAFEKLLDQQSLPSVVLLTSSTNARDIEKSKIYRIAAYVEKPLTEEKLRQLLSELGP